MILNFTSQQPSDVLYSQGYLPQRNQKKFWYQDTSSRSNLSHFHLNSENRRILKTTENWQFSVLPLMDFNLTPPIKKQITDWTKALNWNFPPSSIKTVFKNHIFNTLYLWHQPNMPVQAYALCYYQPIIGHIAYVYYDPLIAKSNLPIRLVLQAVIDCHQANRQYCYLGGFNPATKYGYYKRTMPGFEYYTNPTWTTSK